MKKNFFDTELKNISDRVTSNKYKHLQIENKLKQLAISSYFKGKSHFEEDGTQNNLVFQGVYKYFEDVAVSKTLIKF